MPAPISLNSLACSMTCEGMPWPASAIAVVSPPMPPPTIRTCSDFQLLSFIDWHFLPLTHSTMRRLRASLWMGRLFNATRQVKTHKCGSKTDSGDRPIMPGHGHAGPSEAVIHMGFDPKCLDCKAAEKSFNIRRTLVERR